MSGHTDRRGFLRASAAALGAPLLRGWAQAERPRAHFPPRVRRVVFLFMAGGPSQLDLWDPKPRLVEASGKPMPESLTRGKRVAQLQGKPLVAMGSRFAFARHGKAGTWVSELLPHTAGIVDRICVVQSMFTESINHDPGMTMMQTGAEQAGRPSMGAWISHGLGSNNRDLPEFAVMISGATSGAQPLYARLWGAAFLAGRHQGINLRAGAEPLLFLNDAPGVSRGARREVLDSVLALNRQEHAAVPDPEIETRSEAYELAYRLQASVPELMDLRSEPRHVLDLYGVQPGERSFAMNCLIARRMLERDVRFVQLYDRGWDHHQDLPAGLRGKCRETDRGVAALVLDLEQRGLLDDTLVIWGGEFGRTPMNQGDMTQGNYGRDHHGQAFSMWLAGGGVRRGHVHGATDEMGYAIVEDGVHVHDLHATVLHLLGIDHERLTARYLGRDFRLTDVAGKVVRGILA